MTWALLADQRKLLDIFGGQQVALRDVRELNASYTPSQFDAELLLLWANDPRPDGGSICMDEEKGLPQVLVVNPKIMREFLAWASTVVGGFRPFTGFFKVISRNYLSHAIRPQEPTLGRLENAFIGLILGETLAHSASNQVSLAALSLLPCESTYSFTFARAWALGFRNAECIRAMADSWALARKLTRQPVRKVSDEMIQTAISIIAFLGGVSALSKQVEVSSFIREACCELYHQGEVTRSWSLLANTSGEVCEEMRGPREQRVRTFERVIRGSTDLEPMTASFLTGFMADQIGPGSLEHLDLIASYLQVRPMAAIWYGLCAGLHPQSEVKQVGNCLGRRIARDLLAPDPIVSRPKYDLSVHELEVCLDREVPVEFRTASQNHMAVELLPGVPALVKWPIREAQSVAGAFLSSGRGPKSSTSQGGLFDGSDGDLAHEGQAVVAEIEKSTSRVREILAEIMRRRNDEGRSRGGERRKRGPRR